jgi:hypothetical protein
MDDKNFWEKYLPSLRTSHKLNEMLNDPQLIQSPESRYRNLPSPSFRIEDQIDLYSDRKEFCKYIDDMTKEAINRMQMKSLSSYDSSSEVIILLRKALALDCWSANERQQLDQHYQVLQKPRLRNKRNITTSNSPPTSHECHSSLQIFLLHQCRQY